MMKKTIICCLVAISLGIAGCGTDYNQVFNSAINEFNNGNYDKAKKQYELIINNSTNDALIKRAKTELENYDQKVAEHKKYTEDLKEKEKQAAKEREEKAKQEAQKRAEQDRIEKEKAAAVCDEMAESYNTVLSNQLPDLYGGCGLSPDFTYVVVYAKPMWYSLNEGYKKAFVKKTMQIYMGMLGARSISINTDHLSFYIKDPNTNETLASWGSIRGIHIED